MDDFESLNSKTDADLAQIAVAFGDYTADEVKNKTREDLIAAIMNGGAKLSQPTIAQVPDVPVFLQRSLPRSAPHVRRRLRNPKMLKRQLLLKSSSRSLLKK